MDDDGHPLLVELNSLRETAARFQHEAHAAAIKLQRHSLEASRIHEHAAALEQENARLVHEIDVLRTHPETPHHPAVAQVQELTLALRRVSDKITLTENTLLERTTELAHVRSELSRTRHAADGAYELAAHMRAREEAAKVRERELEFKAHASEEERKMVDLVVQEYADLVRKLEGRKSANPIANGCTSLVDILRDGKFNLHRVQTAFSAESESLRATIAELNAKVSNLQMSLDAERAAASHDRTLLSQTKAEFDKLSLEDQTAAKMVARYMKFSQASTNALQQQIMTLKTRHASMISTVELQLSITESQLASERAHAARLQDALDELCEDLARESYGRRREVALRLTLLSREEGVTEYMRRWARRARELYARCYNSSESVSPGDAVQEAFHRVVTDAESLLSTLDDEVYFSDGTRISGSMTRITLSRAAVDALRNELQEEMRRRVEAVRRGTFSPSNRHQDVVGSAVERPTQPENTSSQEGEVLDRLPLTPNSDSKPEHDPSPVASPQPQDSSSPVLMVGAPDTGDPFVVLAPVAPPAADIPISDPVIVQEVPSPSTQESASTSATLLVDEEVKAIHSHSPAMSMLDLGEPSCKEELSTTDVTPINVLSGDTHVLDAQGPEDKVTPSTLISTIPAVPEEPPAIDMKPVPVIPSHTPILEAQILAGDDSIVPSSSASILMPEAAHAALNPTDPLSTLLPSLRATKHRYDALRRAFRDCSLALKELKRTLAPSSPSPHTQTRLRQHLETALARIDDYAEDARVELEIRIADEELTLRGFEMVLSVPGALTDADERVEVEVSARAFVDGTDESVTRAMDKFEKKLEDVQHDVAAVKLAVHGSAMEEEKDGEVRDGDESDDDGKDTSGGSGWTAWTAGLLGVNSTPSRSPTPVQTFGTVMTSPRLRHASSLKQLHGQENSPDRGPLAGLNLRIPMPLPSHVPWTQQFGLGRPVETRPRTLSAMYAVGGLRSSSIGLGVGLGGSPTPARTRGMAGLGMGLGSTPSPLHAGGTRNRVDDTKEVVDGEVE